MRTFIGGKIHSIRVTDANIDYFGSVSIDSELLAAAGIAPYEQVHVVNLANGNRWVTYALPSGPGVFTLNGGGAFLGGVGDRCVVMSYVAAEAFPGARAVFVDENNAPTDILDYETLTQQPQ